MLYPARADTQLAVLTTTHRQENTLYNLDNFDYADFNVAAQDTGGCFDIGDDFGMFTPELELDMDDA